MVRPKMDIKERFLKHVNKTNSCWLWLGSKHKEGYGHFRVGDKILLAHRVSYELYIKKIPIGFLICHSCDNPICVNPDHLFIGTDQDNTNDKVDKKRHCAGKEMWNAKLTEKDVNDIRSKYANEIITMRELSKEYNVSCGRISDIINRRSWNHI